jgi:hypothetical protein
MRFRIVERSALEFIGSPPRKTVGYLSGLADTDNRSRTSTSGIDPRSILPGAAVFGNHRRVASSVSALRPDIAPARFGPAMLSPLLAHRVISLRSESWSLSAHSGHRTVPATATTDFLGPDILNGRGCAFPPFIHPLRRTPGLKNHALVFNIDQRTI